VRALSHPPDVEIFVGDHVKAREKGTSELASMIKTLVPDVLVRTSYKALRSLS
jgi:hypothetical protein